MTDSFGEAMRSFANTVCVVATAHGGQRFGLMSTAVCCVAFDEPTLLITVNRKASSHDPIAGSGAFSVNVLREDQEPISVRFTGFRGHKGEARFEGAEWTSLETGAPVLKGAVAAFDCRVAESKPLGGQTLFFGQVVAIARAPGEPVAPLVYLGRGYATVRAA
jgi:flavin reductase (DIM6/NTAB) family NADH-FMN oxidoreductase RutF